MRCIIEGILGSHYAYSPRLQLQLLLLLCDKSGDTGTAARAKRQLKNTGTLASRHRKDKEQGSISISEKDVSNG